MGYDMSIADRDVDPDDGYFHVNISGMEEFHEEMRRYGMLNDAAYRPDASERQFEYDDEGFPMLTPWEPTPVLGIPTFKISSMDGELVTPREIRRALAEYDSQPHPDRPGFSTASRRDATRAQVDHLRATLGPEAARFLGPDLLQVKTDQDVINLHRKLWGSWIDFLRLAVLHGGFYVC